VKRTIFAFMALSLMVAGCGKAAAPKQQAQLNSDSLSVNSADTLLAAQPGQPEAQKPAEPAPANIVVNQEAAPLVETSAPASSSTETPDPKNIQQALKNLGLYNGDIDGKIGPKTKEAVKEFQQRHNLEVDGKVGPKTWALLKSALASSAQPAAAPQAENATVKK